MGLSPMDVCGVGWPAELADILISDYFYQTCQLSCESYAEIVKNPELCAQISIS
jgi:hypothetical protein